MSQNIYDNEAFFQEYSNLPRSVGGLGAAPEWPALRGLVPSVAGCRVLDLGCGFGWFCRWARQQRAASVLGVDVSERMLARARAETQDSQISYARVDLEEFVPEGKFELAYSSLAFHYLENLGGLLKSIHSALVSRGKLVFSVEHPIFTAPVHPGWWADSAGEKAWPVNHYLEEGARSTNWLVHDVIKQHRTIETYLRLLREAGFAVSRLTEWGPSEEQVATHPDCGGGRERPLFLLVACERARTSSD